MAPDLSFLLRLWAVRADDAEADARQLGPGFAGTAKRGEADAIRLCIADLNKWINVSREQKTGSDQ